MIAWRFASVVLSIRKALYEAFGRLNPCQLDCLVGQLKKVQLGTLPFHLEEYGEGRWTQPYSF